MENILFVNACPRQRGVSRTLFLADSFLSTIKNKNSNINITELYLLNENINFLCQKDIALRDTLLQEKDYENPMFKYAKEFAKADKIIIAAPYWDLSFPAILKAYIENICVCSITFTYTQNGVQGLCRAKKLAYLSTAGSFVSNTLGAQYIQSVAKFLGIDNFVALTVGGFDIEGANASKLLDDGCKKASNLAISF